MAHRVNTAVKAMESAGGDALRDRPAREPDSNELRARYKTVLAGRDPGQLRVGWITFPYPW